jgi:hypothetical protein
MMKVIELRKKKFYLKKIFFVGDSKASAGKSNSRKAAAGASADSGADESGDEDEDDDQE